MIKFYISVCLEAQISCSFLSYFKFDVSIKRCNFNSRNFLLRDNAMSSSLSTANSHYSHSNQNASMYNVGSHSHPQSSQCLQMTAGQGNFGKMGCNFNSNGNQLFQTAFMSNGNSYQNSTAATTSGRNTRKSPANTTASKSDERSTVKSNKLQV